MAFFAMKDKSEATRGIGPWESGQKKNPKKEADPVKDRPQKGEMRMLLCSLIVCPDKYGFKHFP
ncbi:hypothetical protein DP120_07465 [Planococcus halotolerans]|uniref:Uncharacterized protein n=1 Tax=Planococcus halotolerans TaxID=2233542 RepID=A0A365L1W0_9BACL|nr:hypothetical protein DP120_07465 [Planococcus halotolerans]